MLIESKIKRIGGTHVTIGGASYHFKERKPNGPHIEEVENDDHIGRFLSVHEAYKVYREEAGKTVERGLDVIEETSVDEGITKSDTDEGTDEGITKSDTDEDELAKPKEPRKTAADKASEVVKDDTSAPSEPINDPVETLTAAEKAAKEAKELEAELAERRATEKAESVRYAAAVKASGMDEAQADLVMAVLKSPDAADDEAVTAAFVATHGRDPNPKSKRETVIKHIGIVAAEKGLVVAE